jgi:hypothetical protein
MIMDQIARDQKYGPWNPGLHSPVPSNIRHLSTMLNTNNVSTPLDEAEELASFSGLSINQIVKFRPERLAIHETLLRVTANISIPDGSRYEDLGINFRKIVSIILEKYVDPRMSEIISIFELLDKSIMIKIKRELDANLFKQTPTQNTVNQKKSIARLFRSTPTAPQQDPAIFEPQIATLWQQKKATATTIEAKAMYDALINVTNSIRGVHGQIRGGVDLISSLVNSHICNTYGSLLIGKRIELIVLDAAKKEGFRLLPTQKNPIIMNTKGASASGKSTLRPYQKKLTKAFGRAWTDFALISPDIWRKFLLDYDSLGDAYKYAGPLTGDENAIIDQKLDIYMARKADGGRMSHLLIDRFRFDSFTPVADENAGSTLLTRFGGEVYMFFLVTPPEETVERSWTRGEEVGRYKSVGDLLHHNVEAYTGMPRLFFTWALKTDKSVHYEFLDNDVPLGSRPKTIAFGQNGNMTILDVNKTLDIERYKKINLKGKTPNEIYPDSKKMRANQNVGFLLTCAKLLLSITFADQATGKIYGKMKNGEINWTDGDLLAHVTLNKDTKTALEILTGSLPLSTAREPRVLDSKNARTLGQWGVDC